jgi:hypothetical protein
VSAIAWNVAALLATSLAAAPPGAATVAGVVTTPYPTIRNLAVEWAFSGDEDGDGAVSVRYRRAGEAGWRTGMPLRRVPAGSNEGFTWASRHTGSVFDLEPGTTYEVELTLVDPDGGSATRTVTATTRRYPAAMANAPVRSATPATLASALSAALPGDVVELAAGSYAGFMVGRDGAAGKPIVIRSAGGATVNGTITLSGRKHVHVQGLRVNGSIKMNGTDSVAIVGNTIETTGDGIVFITRSQNNYVADNVVTGATAWAEASLGVNGANVGEGIWFTGPGHVIEHNRVRGFRDCISFMEEAEAVEQFSIDVLENDISVGADDAIEADFCFHNCRVMRNRITNSFTAISSQPSLGGPTYFVRNVIYNALHAFKLNRGSDGDVILHNTVVKSGDAFSVYAGVPHYRQFGRNNIFIGGPGGTYGGYANGSGKVLALADADLATQDLDYDGYGSTTGTFGGRVGSVTFTTLAGLQSGTSEKHAVQLGLGVFAAAVAYPSSPMTEKPVPDLRLKAASAAEDAGAILPNVNDGFTGRAPDLGAYEIGQPLPAYGPRSRAP